MDLLARTTAGFDTLSADAAIKASALTYLRQWLAEPDFAAYQPQLAWLIESQQWAGLLDRFCQILPFGTGGRRGAVGIGPNRMNLWTLGASIQGHCEYLKENFPDDAALRVVVAYDVRQFEDRRKSYNPDLPNPALHLTSKDFAQYAVGVYAANGIHASILPENSSRYLATPELSFIIRRLKAHGGLNISASHNPPDDNGGKFYDEHGAQPVPPDDQIMADLVEQVTTIKHLSWTEAVRSGRVHFLEDSLHDAYIALCCRQSLVPPPRGDEITVVFTPLHGVGAMTAMEVLQKQGFRVLPVEEQMKPDADRLGAAAAVNSGHKGATEAPDWPLAFLNGNSIAALLTHFKLEKLTEQGRMPPSPIVVKTLITTSLVTRIARHFKAQVVENLLVGFKYIAEVLKQLEEHGAYEDVRGTPDDFVIASEESHGILVTPHIHDKDAGASALLLAELALDQKRRGRSVTDYLHDIEKRFGYFRTDLQTIVMSGIEGKQQMARMLDALRRSPPREIAGLAVTHFEDLRSEDSWLGPLKGATDAAARNFLLFRFGERARLALRPSGTEPKAKAYVEVGSAPCPPGTPAHEWQRTCRETDELAQRLSEEFLRTALATVGLTPTKR